MAKYGGDPVLVPTLTSVLTMSGQSGKLHNLGRDQDPGEQ